MKTLKMDSEQPGLCRGYSWSERAAELVSEEVSESSGKILG